MPEAPVVLFLGAGASASIGFPTTKQFLETIGLEPYNEETLQNTMRDDSDLLRDIYTKLRVQDIEGVLDFLRIYNDRSDLGGFIPSHIGLDIIKENMILNPPFNEEANKEKMESIFSFHLDKMRSLEGRIKRRIHRAYFFDDDHLEKSKALYLPLIDFLFRDIYGEIDELPIFTTNYDFVFDQLNHEHYRHNRNIDFRDGFEYDNDSLNFIFDQGQYIKRRQHNTQIIKFYKLHGSLNWAERKKDNRIVKFPKLTTPLRDPNYNGPLLIYPAGYGPYPRDEFHIMHEQFEESLINAKMCIVIGFSFRDIGRINHIFEDVMRYKNEELHVEISSLRPTIDGLRETKNLFDKFPGRYTYHGGGVQTLLEKLQVKYKTKKKQEKIDNTKKEPI